MAANDVSIIITATAPNAPVPQVQLFHGTGVKFDRETNSSSVTTFDEVIPQGTSVTPYTIEIDRCEYDSVDMYKDIDIMVDYMVDNPVDVTVKEIKRIPGADPFTVIRRYKECILDGDSVEIKPEELTVDNFKIRASRLEKTYE